MSASTLPLLLDGSGRSDPVPLGEGPILGLLSPILGDDMDVVDVVMLAHSLVSAALLIWMLVLAGRALRRRISGRVLARCPAPRRAHVDALLDEGDRAREDAPRTS